jgi:predicted MFS family arabinose efflux permease
VLALYMAVNQGSMPLGALFAGLVSERLGVRWVLGIGSAMIALTFVVAATYLVRLAGGWTSCVAGTPSVPREGIDEL